VPVNGGGEPPLPEANGAFIGAAGGVPFPRIVGSRMAKSATMTAAPAMSQGMVEERAASPLPTPCPHCVQKRAPATRLDPHCGQAA
jgi:hypothetical protein